MRWKGGLALGLALAAGVLLVGAGGSPGSAVETRPWQKLPDPPLSPRELPTGFWTGHEVVLVGGSDAPPCPPNASCEAPEVPPLADGAAYNPASNSWRAIADAPVGFAWAEPVVIGSTAYLWIAGESYRPDAPSAFLAYRIDSDRWEELPRPVQDGEEGWYHLAAVSDRVVAYASSDEERERPDFVFDPGSATWSKLPDDPFSPGFDRSMYRSGEELLLLDHEIVSNPDENLPLRGAVLNLESGVWRVLVDPDAALARTGWKGPDDFVHAGTVRAAGADYRLRAGIVLEEETGSWLLIPELDPLEFSYGGTTDVTAGTDLFVFLGSSWPEGDPDGELHSEAWLWSPGSSS